MLWLLNNTCDLPMIAATGVDIIVISVVSSVIVVVNRPHYQSFVNGVIFRDSSSSSIRPPLGVTSTPLRRAPTVRLDRTDA